MNRSTRTALLGALALLTGGCGATPSITVPPARQVFPAPPPGAVVFSRQHDDDALALALVPRVRTLVVQVSLVGQDGAGVGGVGPRVRLVGTRGESLARTRPCGPGCYRAVMSTRGHPRQVDVLVAGGAERFRLPEKWPPPRADSLVARATAAWRRLRTLVFHEHLASSRKHAIDTVWRAAAPNRLRYDTAGGASGIVIGSRRWDKLPGGRWSASPQSPLVQPRPPWTRVANARILGSGRVRGLRAWHVSFYDPGLPAWFTAWIAKRSLRTLDLRMVTTAHFMHDVYGPFNAPLVIRPPD